jgi:hypothetical protein
VLRISAALPIAVALALTLPGVATAAASAYWGGGGIVDRAPKVDQATYVASFGVGLRRSADGTRIGVRVSFALGCARQKTTWRSTDAVVSGALAVDGSFHLHAVPVRTQEMGTVRVTIDGVALPGHADGTVKVTTKLGCGLSARPFTTWQIDPAAPAAGAPAAPADGLLYGITDQGLKAGGVPHPLIVKVEDGGTVAHAYTSYDERCTGRDRKGAFHEAYGVQIMVKESPVTAAGWVGSLQHTETAAQRRHHIDYSRTFAWKGAFDGATVRGTLSDTQRYAAPDLHQRCVTPTSRFFAVA